MSGFSGGGGGRTNVKKAGTLIGSQQAINLVEGANINITVADDPGNGEVDITIAATGGGGGSSGFELFEEGVSQGIVTEVDFVGSMVTASAVGDAGTITIVHGNQSNGSQHTVADGSNAGFMSASDYTKLAAISGTNTGDQTITLTGDVTGSGTGSFATTIANASVTLAKMADLAQDQFIGRTTASTGVPQTATITSAARTVLDDTTVAAMVDTLGGASSTGTGGIARATSPTFVTPTLGVASATTINKVALTAPASGSTLTIADGATLTASANATVSGTNTGDQTITLTGDVTGSGTGSFATTIGSKKVTIGMLADGTDGELITWNSSGVAATVAVGTAGHVLTSNGTGAAPTFQAASGGGVTTQDEGVEAGTGQTILNFVGDGVTAASVGSTTTITVPATSLADGSVTLAKMANIATDRLIGRDTAGTGVPEALTVGGGVEFTGSGGIQRSALTGDVTASAGSGSTTIANAAVTLAKMANLAQDQFIGRTTASTGVPETATITAAARTVLDDTTVAAMVDTLGGASSTGTGGLARATSPTFVTPTLGVASATTLTLTNDLAVSEGGTGASTFTADAILKGNTTSAIVASGVTISSTNGISGHVEVQNVQTGTTYTISSTDTGKVLIFTNGSAVTVTIPQTLVVGFNCRWEQRGAGKVSFNGTAVTAATLNNRQSHVASAGQYAVGGIAIYTAGTPAVATLFGDTGT